MGLFKKPAKDPDELVALKAEVAAMGARLAASESEKHQIGTQVRGLEDRLASVIAAPAATRPTVDPAELMLVNARIQRLTDRLEVVATSAVEPVVTPAPTLEELAELRDTVSGLAHRIDAVAMSAGQPTAAPAPSLDEFAELRAAVSGLVERIERPAQFSATPTPPPPPPVAASPETVANPEPVSIAEIHQRLDAMAERISGVDQRVTSISTELANQLSELSGEIDAIGTNQPTDEHLVAEIREAQTRLSNEQARYQIAFRQDLADLAERLKRS